MNLHVKAVLLGVAVISITDSLRADQPQISFTKGSSGTWNSDWAGISGRTYFVQWSLDLVNWQFLPYMEFGTGMKTRSLSTQNAPRFFVRLKYVDETGITSLQQARDADFDGDGIPNWYEIETLGTDPLNKTYPGEDSDSDGMVDGWEKYLIDSNPNDAFTSIADIMPGADFDGDGIKNYDENRFGTHALVNDITITGDHVQYTYDLDNLTSVTYQVGSTASWNYDENLNLNSVSE